MRPGLSEASGRKVRRPSMTAARSMPRASAAAVAASTLATLWRDSPLIVMGTSTTDMSRSGTPESVRTVTRSSRTVIARPPSPKASRMAGELASREKTHGMAGEPVRIAQTRGSSPLSTVHPSGRVARVMMALTSASWSMVSTPWRPRWSADTLVTTDTSLCETPSPLRSKPPRAVSRMPISTPGALSTPRAPAGPEKSPGSIIVPWSTTPSVELHAVCLPAVIAMWASNRVVDVLPLVPVMEATGMRGVRILAGTPSGAARTTAACSSTTSPPASHAARTGATDSPKAWAGPRRRHTNDTTTTERSPPERERTPRRLVPDARDTCRTARSARRAMTRWRCSVSGDPAWMAPNPAVRATRRTVSVSASR